MADNGISKSKHDNCQLAIGNYQFLLKRYWGYDSFRGIQQEIIESICAGKDTLGLMPTGGGKSLTFQVPALAMRGTCIVITPLISLMKDQVDHLRKKGIKAYAIYSGMTRDEIITILENCIFSDVKLLYVSPERLSSELFQTKLKKMHVSFITVDEAHCISQWGYDFRPSYLEIAKIRELLTTSPQPSSLNPRSAKDGLQSDLVAEPLPGITPPLLALTATATPDVEDDIQEQLHFKEKNVIRMSFARENLTYVVRKAHDKYAELIHILQRVEGSAIVYVRSRKRTKEIAEYINTHLNLRSATFYHAGLEPTVKDQRQEDWQEDRVRVMVATNAFGMGIDKADVRLVIHMDVPSSLEAYFQEAGRAGRDGKRAYAVMLHNDSDFSQLQRRITDTFPPKTAPKGMKPTDENYPKDNICDIYDHLAYFYQIGVGSGRDHTFEFNIDKFCVAFHHYPVRVNAALQILQRAGYIDFEQNPDTSARIKFLLARDELYRLGQMETQENAVITALLRNYSGLFTDYGYIDEAYIAQEADIDRNQTYQTLKRLHQKRIIDFIPRKNIPFITYTKDRIDGSELIITAEAYEKRKQQFEQRIQSIITYLQDDYTCRSCQLLRYFGEKSAEECGHCDTCLNHNRNHRNSQQQEPVRNAILDHLADGKEHLVAELKDLPFDSHLIDAALRLLLDEEQVYMDDCNIYKAP